jgi:DNA-binding beta-propeller fold protein YncE
MRTAAFVLTITALGGCSASDGDAVVLPDAGSGLGFDDLRWSPATKRVLAPGARSGRLALVDPDTMTVTSVAGFGRTEDFDGGHDDGPTSVDEGHGLLYVTDRTTKLLVAVDPQKLEIVHRVSLSTSPDYVRYVAPTNEVWVAEPAGSQIEIFQLAADGKPTSSIATIFVSNGPESLVIDAPRGRAYAHHWQKSTLAIDLRTHAIVHTWENGCAASRGIELEPEHGWVLSACSEGTVTVADPESGRVLSSIAAGAGYDVMGYARDLRHVYVAGSACGCLTMLGLSSGGELGLLGRFDAPSDTHCVVADDRRHAWVCAPSEGGLRRIADPFPSWGMAQ